VGLAVLATARWLLRNPGAPSTPPPPPRDAAALDLDDIDEEVMSEASGDNRSSDDR
jgi:hypothetical protein